jgi:hypothetical protein
MAATKALIMQLCENLEPPSLDHPRVLFQFHVEGPAMHGESHRTLDDPDAMRSDSYWAPLDSIIATDAMPGRQTWADFCDELRLPDDIRSLYPEDSAVKTWEEVCQEAALPPSWGTRTQLTIAVMPESAAVPEMTRVAPVSAPARDGSGFDHMRGGGLETRAPVTDAMKRGVYEIPALADELIAKAAGPNPIESMKDIAAEIANDADDRYTFPGRVPGPGVERDGGLPGSLSTESLEPVVVVAEDGQTKINFDEVGKGVPPWIPTQGGRGQPEPRD